MNFKIILLILALSFNILANAQKSAPTAKDKLLTLLYYIDNYYVEEVNEDELRKELLEVVTKEIGPIAKPDKIQVVKGLPKTRSGKIMRRILRKIAEGDTSNLGDTSTLLDPTVVEEIKHGAKSC